MMQLLAPAAPHPTTSGPQTAAAPAILLTATLRWPIAARLAIAFAGMGCPVEAVCPRQHPVARTRALRTTYPYSAVSPLVSLRAAIASAAPDLIIPCDDNAAVHLNQLYLSTTGDDPASNALKVVLARSLGTPAACALATARGDFMALAADEGVRIPPTCIAKTQEELAAWMARHRLPCVIKIDSTWGGQGVAIVRSHEEARSAFVLMSSRPSLRHALARLLLDRDLSPLLNVLKGSQRTVTLQEFIVGTPANRAVACWQGQVLAGNSVEAIQTQHATGPATVVRVIENAEMNETAQKLVRRLGLSGLWGIDFVLEAGTGAAYMIELNPRATPISHLALGDGHSLPAALIARFTGALPPVPASTIEDDVIALFPGEWRRDPASPHLSCAHHDIPWDEPGLVQDCIARPWAERGWIARLWALLRPRSFARQAGPQDPASSHSSAGKALLQLVLDKLK
ncbi:MAG: ATP-grasp domain-containing protein [Burkholderiales bacterium]|nr:ATP-grasp domain-containing protein [Burkholderiales bacterium]